MNVALAAIVLLLAQNKRPQPICDVSSPQTFQEHGSWLNVAESELAALKKRCLSRRIGDRGELARELRAWVDRRNDAKIGADWRFTTTQARIKLHRLYPSTDR